MKDEVKQILKMVEDGKITAEQAVQLMEAGKLDEEVNHQDNGASRKSKWLKVRVYEAGTNKRKVNVTLPLALVSVGLKMGMHFGHKEALEGFDLNEIIRMIEAGEEGKLVDVVDDERGEKIEVFVE